MSQYASIKASAAVTRKATPDQLWLEAQIDRIDKNASEMGNDGSYTRVLETLVFEQRNTMPRLDGEAKVMRDLLGEAYSRLDPMDADDYTLQRKIEAALRGGA